LPSIATLYVPFRPVILESKARLLADAEEVASPSR
jgi:hypothetical protein